jgi:N-acetylglucosamine repressor
LQSNSGKILSIVRECEQIHQTELARMLGIEKSTVSRIVKKLTDDDLLINAGELPAGKTGGRKSVLLQLNPEGAYAVAIDLGVEKSILALVNQQGRIKSRKELATPANKSPDSIIQFLQTQITAFLKRKSLKGLNVLGIGIASPGIIDCQKGELISTFCFDGWRNVPLASVLSTRIGMPVFLDNNVRLEAIGEKCFGVCRGINDFLCISTHYGIGLGIFSGGKIFRGAHHQAGDMHLSLDREGPKCRCGRKGCIEALAGTKVILERFKNKGITCIDDICDAVTDGNTEIQECLKESGEYIGQFVAHLTELFDPEKVVLGGPLMFAGDVLFDAVQSSYRKHGHKDR